MPPLLMAALVAATPEIEILGGYLAGGTNDPRAVALSVRVGVDFSDHLTLSGMFIGIPGPEAQYASGALVGRVDPSGMQAWSALADIRLHTSGLLQAHIGAGLGVGQLLNWQCSDKVNCTENGILHGHPSFAAQASAGLRLQPDSWHGFSFGTQFALNYWTGQDDVPNLALHPSWQQRASARLMWAVQAALAYRFR
jgi:hypothetical protein